MCPFNTQVDEAGPVFETLDGVTDGSGEGFNTLAGYLFGNNTQEVCYDHRGFTGMRVCYCICHWVCVESCLRGGERSERPTSRHSF